MLDQEPIFVPLTVPDHVQEYGDALAHVSDSYWNLEALSLSANCFPPIIDSFPQILWQTDARGSSIYLSAQWYAFTGIEKNDSSRASLAAALHPDDKARVVASWRSLRDNCDKYEEEFRVRRHDGVYRWFLARAGVVRDPETKDPVAFVGTCTDIDDLKQSKQLLHDVVESSPDCIKTLDLNGCLLTMSDSGCRLMDIDDFQSIRGSSWTLFASDTETQTIMSQAIEIAKGGGVGRFQSYCPTMKGRPKWWDVVVTPILGADGKPVQLLGLSREITQQKVSEQRELLHLTDIFLKTPAFMAALRGPNHVIELANESFLRLIGKRNVIGKPIADALPEVIDHGYLEMLDAVYRTGTPFVGRDVRIFLQVQSHGAPEERFLDFTYIALRDKDGQVVGILIHGSDLTERKQLEREKERLLVEERARLKREHLLDEIGAKVRATDSSADIHFLAAQLLGKALRLDLCHFGVLDNDQQLWVIEPDWHRPDLQSLAGDYPLGVWNSISNKDVGDSSTIIYSDIRTDSNFPDSARRFYLKSNCLAYVSIPFLDSSGLAVAALSAAMAKPYVWSSEEIELVEAVAKLTRSASEAARIRVRESNIATRLQDALQPPLPANAPGLAISMRYEAALEEAGVGGDFYDVFALDSTRTALVVGDLSGKGLAAAAQVAAVRYMLRATLYTSTTISEAVKTLNGMLSDRMPIRGFATLFVSIFDNADRTLTYVNCGQEAAICWRAENETVEQLSSTGTVIGAIRDAEFEQKTLKLQPFDALAVFTDGLTEVGPNRSQMLGVEGLTCLWNQSKAIGENRSPASIAESIINDLTTGADLFAEDTVRDDVCLLVAVVEPL